MNFGAPETPEEEAFAQLDAFIEAGGNLIDTADFYKGGGAEETVGRWLAARPSMTNVGGPSHLISYRTPVCRPYLRTHDIRFTGVRHLPARCTGAGEGPADALIGRP